MRRDCTKFHLSKQGTLHAHVEDALSMILIEHEQLQLQLQHGVMQGL